MALKPVPQTADTPRRVSVLGATGSIGCNTLDLVGRSPDAYQVVALTANSNVALLAEQAKNFKAERAVIADESRLDELRDALSGTDVEVAGGQTALLEAASMPADWVMAAIVGAAGLAPTLAAVRQGAHIALANKECLVCAGQLFLKEVRQSGAVLLPADSEHNAIFQVLDPERYDAVDRITLTASGGPFLNASVEKMAKATPAQAVKHPQWSMGAKISIDSATLMNKGLEVIEAHYLFPVGLDRLNVIVHPQSIIHSMVAYRDGSVLAQLGAPDMRTPISYTLSWPDRLDTPVERLDLATIGQLTFQEPDLKRFPALALCREALRIGGSAPTLLNAANEVAVEAFLAEKIGFLQIAEAVADSLETLVAQNGAAAPQSLEEVAELDDLARQKAAEWVQNHRT